MKYFLFLGIFSWEFFFLLLVTLIFVLRSLFVPLVTFSNLVLGILNLIFLGFQKLGEKWLIDFGFTQFDFGFPVIGRWS